VCPSLRICTQRRQGTLGSLAADGTVLSLSKLLDVMFASGLIQLSANEAAIKWQESLENMDATFKKYGNNLDITTEGGKANKRALDGMAQAGIANMQAMANNGAGQEELQGKLRGTYDSLIATLGQFDITGTAADDMARSVLGIPTGVPIDTSIQGERQLAAGDQRRPEPRERVRRAGIPGAFEVHGRGYGQAQSFSGYHSSAGVGVAAAGPASFEGNLYLDSGEFLGKVRGMARQEASGVVAAADSQSQYKRVGRR
jgi:hypothetical protein